MLPILLLLCFIIAAALGLYALSFLRAMLVAERGNQLAMNAAAVAETVDRVLFERHGDIQLFANDVVLQEGTSEEKTARLLHYNRLYWYYSWLGITDTHGHIVAATAALSPPGAQVIDPVSFESVRQTGTIRLEKVTYTLESQQQRAVGFMAPMYGPRGEFRGVVASRVPIENLRTIFEQEGRLRYGQDIYDWLLLTHDGIIISEKQAATSAANEPEKLEIFSQARAAADRNHSGFVEEIHHRLGNSVVTGYASTRGYRDFPGFDWIVLFRQTHEQVYAPVDRLLWTVGGIGILVILPLTGFGILVSWKLGRERTELIKTRQNLEQSVEAKVINHLTVRKDGVEALAFLRRQGVYAAAPRPHLIVLDLNLPKKDGREVLADIKADDKFKRIPVVVLTTSQDEQDVLKSYNIHANCYITKPVDLDQFVRVVRSIEDFWLGIVVLPASNHNGAA